MALSHQIGQLIVFGLCIIHIDTRIAESTRRTIILHHDDVGGSDADVFRVVVGLLVLAGLSYSAVPVMGPAGTTISLMQAILMTMTNAMTEQVVSTTANVAVIPSSTTLMPPITIMMPVPPIPAPTGPCMPSPCLNQGLCNSNNNVIHLCICPPGFCGNICECALMPGATSCMCP